MTWTSYYRGDGLPREVALADPPPWRRFPRLPQNIVFQPPEGLTDVVNAALCLRRPLLITGAPGSGKSTVIESVAAELKLGEILRWHVTSRSTLSDALYRYDALGRIHAQQLKQTDDIATFLQLGPLGTALLPAEWPRALLIDEIDKSDLDLASDLLDVLERGEFEITELARHEHGPVPIRLWNSSIRHTVAEGRVRCSQFPFIVMTSNGERDFPAPFLRRCIRFDMPAPTAESIGRVVRAHLDIDPTVNPAADLIGTFLARVESGDEIAVDQLLNALFLLSAEAAPQGSQRAEIVKIVLRELSHR